MTNPNDTAFPATQIHNDIDGNVIGTSSHSGMTLREYMATQIIVGLCVQAIPGQHNSNNKQWNEERATAAVDQADALIKILNEGSK